MISIEQRDKLLVIEFNLENLEEELDQTDPARVDLHSALVSINRAMKRS